MSCHACEALTGGFDSTFDWMMEQAEENEELKLDSENAAEATLGWKQFFEEERSWDVDFDAPFPWNDCFDAESEVWQYIDVILELLKRGGWEPFSPLPPWMPEQMARFAKELALVQVKMVQANDEDWAVEALVHDCLAPAEERLITMEGIYDIKGVRALACTCRAMATFAHQVIIPILFGSRNVDPSSIHTCGRE